MSFGIVEIISLLLSAGGFGLAPNPKPPTVDATLEYAIPDADFVAHFDAASVIPSNYKVLTSLPDQAAIKALPELAKAARQLINEVDGPRNIAKGMIGFDPVTDLSDLTAFATVVPNQPPTFVVVAHGKFDPAMLDKLAKFANAQVVKVGTASMFQTPDGNAIALKNGTLIVGAVNLVKDRAADSWKAPAHGAGTPLATAADMIAGHPVFGVAMTISTASRGQLLAMHQGQNFLTDLIQRGKGSSFAIYHDGIGWTFNDSTAAGLDQMAQMSDGFVDILRAAQIAPRGFGKIALAALDSYKGVNAQIDAVIAHKADLTKIVAQYSGDGQFKSKIDKDVKNLRLNVRLTGKSVSEVVPAGVVIPLMAVGFFVGRAEKPMPVEQSKPATVSVPPMRKPAQPLAPTPKH